MDQLTVLLTSSASDQIAAECLDRIRRDEDFKYRGDSLLPVARAVEVYSARAWVNAGRGGKVEGYEQLLAGLGTAPGPSVRLHTVEFISHWYIAFTNEASTRLFGILKSPKRKEAWFDPERGKMCEPWVPRVNEI
jgi:hypothetical protein